MEVLAVLHTGGRGFDSLALRTIFMNKDTTLQHPKYDRLTNVVSLRSDFDQQQTEMLATKIAQFFKDQVDKRAIARTLLGNDDTNSKAPGQDPAHSPDPATTVRQQIPQGPSWEMDWTYRFTKIRVRGKSSETARQDQ